MLKCNVGAIKYEDSDNCRYEVQKTLVRLEQTYKL